METSVSGWSSVSINQLPVVTWRLLFASDVRRVGRVALPNLVCMCRDDVPGQELLPGRGGAVGAPLQPHDVAGRGLL